MARQFRSDDTSPWIDRYGNGSAGAGSINTSTDATANTTFSGTQDASTGTAGAGTGFEAGDLILIHQSRNGGDGAGVWELNKIVSVGAGTNWTLTYPLQNDYATTGQVYLLEQYSSYVVNSGQTLTGKAWNGTVGGIHAVLCNGNVTIPGTALITGKGYRGGAGTASNLALGNGTGYTGEGYLAVGDNGDGVGAQAATTVGAGRGGGRDGDGTNGGGGGGYAAAGSNAVGTSGLNGGEGGTQYGTAGLTTMFLGGGGGGGNSWENSTAGGTGAAGGGICLIIAKNITITGAITNAGAAGGTGRSGGGGGAGGSILLKGQNIVLGTTLVTAAGGALGDGTTASDGGAGSAGRIHADYSGSLSGSTSPAIDSRIDTTLADSGFLAFF